MLKKYTTVLYRERSQRKQLPSQSQGTQRTLIACYRCGVDHLATRCRFKEAVCHVCKKRGHIVRMCRSKGTQRRPTRRTNYVQEDQEPREDSAYSMFAVRSQACEPIVKELCIDGVPVEMELDTGAATSVIT